MGQIADVGAQADTQQVIADLERTRVNAISTATKVASLAGDYLAIRNKAADAADTAFLDAKLDESVVKMKAVFDALDPATRAVVDQVIMGATGLVKP